jgi:hypothetical protein
MFKNRSPTLISARSWGPPETQGGGYSLGRTHAALQCVDADRQFPLAQQTNAYGINPASQWNGYSEPPAPEAGTWVDHPAGARDPLAEATGE